MPKDFPIGRYFFQVLDKAIFNERDLIEDPYWQEENTNFRNENVLSGIRDEIRGQISLNNAPFASWLLARLWYLTEGEIKTGLNVDEQGNGGQDGGWYYCQCLITDSKNKALALLYIEGTHYYEQVFLQECSETIDPYELMQVIEETLKCDPNKIMVCHIVVEDYEENLKPYTYGWDGKEFLGQQSIF